MIKPNFFMIGAPKCGTTALSEYLKEHRNVFFSPIKEPQHFDKDLSRDVKMDRKTYLSLFSEVDPDLHKAVGEGSTSYLFSEVAVAEILKFNPDSKFIVMLRNPVELVQAFHSENFFLGMEDIEDFQKAWEAQSERKKGKLIPGSCVEVKKLMYSDWGKLGELVERLFLTVRREKVKVIFFEDFVRDTKQVYKEVLEFLDLIDDGRVEFKKINQNKKVRFHRLQLFLGYLAKMAWRIKTKFNMKIKLGLISGLFLLNSGVSKRKELSKDFRAELYAFYREDVANLSRILGRDLSHWALPKEE